MAYIRCIGGQESNEKAIIDRSIVSITNDEITSIGEYAFDGCAQLESASFLNVTMLKQYAFANCVKLENIYLPNVTYINNDAFNGCTKLKSISFPKVEMLLSNVFMNCDIRSADFSLISVVPMRCFTNNENFGALTLRNSQKVSLQNKNALSGTKFSSDGTGGILYVPSDLLTEYQNDSSWTTVISQNASNQILAIPS